MKSLVLIYLVTLPNLFTTGGDYLYCPSRGMKTATLIMIMVTRGSRVSPTDLIYNEELGAPDAASQGGSLQTEAVITETRYQPYCRIELTVLLTRG